MKVAVAAIVLALLGGMSAVHVARSASTQLQPTAPVARPNPATFGLRVDYVAPLRGADGAVADLPPLDPAVTAAAYLDQSYLHYRLVDDLGGFVNAPLGSAALFSGGRPVVGARSNPQLPLFAQAAGGGINSFTFTGGATLPPPDNGKSPVPGLGVPPVTPPPTPGNTPPPPNQGFGGTPPGTTSTETTTTGRTQTEPTTTGGGGGTTTTPTTTTTMTTTAATTTTATTTTTTTTTPSPGPVTTTTAPPPTTATTTTPAQPPGCFPVNGMSISSNLANCRIYATNMAPGMSTSELVTITNTSGSAYTVSLKASGSHNQLWNDLRMGVYEQSTPAPNPLPPLLDWTTQFNDLATLGAGRSITFVVTLALPSTAGNADQNLGATIDFTWRATG